MKRFEVKMDTHIILKVEDVNKFLNVVQREELKLLLETFIFNRRASGKIDNEYYICNQDEPYAKDVLDVIKKGELSK